MIAGLLYLTGLATVLVTIAVAGYSAPEAVSRLAAAANADSALSVLASYAWVVGPFIGGLMVMGFGRIIMLLTAIDRSLRGKP